MEIQVLKEHEWLRQFLGDWRFEMEGDMGPDQPPMKSTGSESVRAIGDIWIQGDGQFPMPDGNTAASRLTLGYDPAKQRYVGTWLGSMMAFLWIYEGQVDASGKILTLETTGPDMSGSEPGGKMARYQDIWEFVEDGHRILTSQMQAADGSWKRFVTAHYYRQK